MFCLIICNCNKRYLACWGLCNSTCLFIVRGDNTSFYMEFYVSCSTMLRCLKELVPFDGLMLQIKENLRRSWSFGVVVFGNYKWFQSLKYKRNQESSTWTICMSHSFLRAVIPPDLNAFLFPYYKPVLMYHCQAIPLTYEMLKYKSILNQSTYVAFSDCIFLTKIVPT